MVTCPNCNMTLTERDKGSYTCTNVFCPVFDVELTYMSEEEKRAYFDRPREKV